MGVPADTIQEEKYQKHYENDSEVVWDDRLTKDERAPLFMLYLREGKSWSPFGSPLSALAYRSSQGSTRKCSTAASQARMTVGA